MLTDKVRPNNIDEVVFHKSKYNEIKTLVDNNATPHVIVHAPTSCGKNTFINIYLKMIYGSSAERIYEQKHNVLNSSGTKKEIIIKESAHYIIIEPQHNNFDKHIIHDIVKEYAMRPSKFNVDNAPYKTIFIKCIDQLSYYAQFALRRIIESYSKHCRFIMSCNSLSKVIDPIISRCLCIGLRVPSNKKITKWVKRIIKTHKLNVGAEQYVPLIEKASGNLKDVLWGIDRIILNIPTNAYDQSIARIMKLIETKKFMAIYPIRDVVYNVLSTNLGGSKIIKDIVEKLMQMNISLADKSEILEYASKYEIAHNKGRHKIIHIDAFFLHVINKLATLSQTVP